MSKTLEELEKEMADARTDYRSASPGYATRRAFFILKKARLAVEEKSRESCPQSVNSGQNLLLEKS